MGGSQMETLSLLVQNNKVTPVLTAGKSRMSGQKPLSAQVWGWPGNLVNAKTLGCHWLVLLCFCCVRLGSVYVVGSG